MSIADDMEKLHEQHPDWPVAMIAAHLNVDPNTIRMAARRRGITLPPARASSVISKQVFRRVRYAGHDPGSRW